ncbi:hypothetical protein PR048_023291 [Dryococelus australis]|uniref:Uncharacterized protein n=1 Tax=Dryococelus australis TaxID=614101 RepID=A0ABQ9GTN9_9NEOP|nr:hypothetical protein PR048_023291 [Dryococelus australis]
MTSSLCLTWCLYVHGHRGVNGVRARESRCLPWMVYIRHCVRVSASPIRLARSLVTLPAIDTGKKISPHEQQQHKAPRSLLVVCVAQRVPYLHSSRVGWPNCGRGVAPWCSPRGRFSVRLSHWESVSRSASLELRQYQIPQSALARPHVSRHDETGLDSSLSKIRNSAFWKIGGLCHWSVGFLGIISFPSPLKSVAAAYTPHFTRTASCQLAKKNFGWARRVLNFNLRGILPARMCPCVSLDIFFPYRHSLFQWGRGDSEARAVASHQGEPGSISGSDAPRFSHMGNVPVDATGRWVFSGFFQVPHFYIPPQLRTHLASLYPAINTPVLRAVQTSSLYCSNGSQSCSLRGQKPGLSIVARPQGNPPENGKIRDIPAGIQPRCSVVGERSVDHNTQALLTKILRLFAHVSGWVCRVVATPAVSRLAGWVFILVPRGRARARRLTLGVSAARHTAPCCVITYVPGVQDVIPGDHTAWKSEEVVFLPRFALSEIFATQGQSTSCHQLADRSSEVEPVSLNSGVHRNSAEIIDTSKKFDHSDSPRGPLPRSPRRAVIALRAAALQRFMNLSAARGWLDYLPPTKSNRVRLSAGSLPDVRMWESCRMMPLVGIGNLPFFFPSPCIPVLLHTHIASPSSALKTSKLRAAQISSLTPTTQSTIITSCDDARGFKGRGRGRSVHLTFTPTFSNMLASYWLSILAWAVLLTLDVEFLQPHCVSKTQFIIPLTFANSYGLANYKIRPSEFPNSDPGSTPGEIQLGFLACGNVVNYAYGPWFFSGYSRSLHICIPLLLCSHVFSPALSSRWLQMSGSHLTAEYTKCQLLPVASSSTLAERQSFHNRDMNPETVAWTISVANTVRQCRPYCSLADDGRPGVWEDSCAGRQAGRQAGVTGGRVCCRYQKSEDEKGFVGADGELGSPESLPEPERPPLRHIDKYVRPECPCLSKRYTVAVLTCVEHTRKAGSTIVRCVAMRLAVAKQDEADSVAARRRRSHLVPPVAMFKCPPSALTHSRLHSSVSHPLVHSHHEHLARRNPAISCRPQHTCSPTLDQAASVKDCQPLGFGSRGASQSHQNILASSPDPSKPPAGEKGRDPCKAPSSVPTARSLSINHGFPRKVGQVAIPVEGRVRWVHRHSTGQQRMGSKDKVVTNDIDIETVEHYI